MWLTGERARYVSRVLRLRINDCLILFDGQGGEFPAVIREFARDRVLVHVGARQTKEKESPLAIRLVQGISRGARMDVVVQKSAELGVHRITPVLTDYSVVKLEPEKAASRREHWLRICQSACEQCGRNTLPLIDLPRPLEDWLRDSRGAGTTRIVLNPGVGESVSKLPRPNGAVSLLIGPEGGLSDRERTICEQEGFTSVSLGPRILRTETAALAALAVLQAFWGDLK